MSNAIHINDAFGQKEIKFHARVKKYHFGKIAEMALLNPCMKFEKNSAKRILLKHYENDNKKKYP